MVTQTKAEKKTLKKKYRKKKKRNKIFKCEVAFFKF